jgi:hypothetical protein
MKRLTLAAALLAPALLAGCVAPVGPVQVTRFHTPDTSRLGKGAIAVEAAPGSDPASLEWRSYQAAVQRQLALVGYTEAQPGAGGQVAVMGLRRSTYQPQRSGGPVSVGVGAGTGSYGSGVGMGVGIDLSPPPAAEVETELNLSIRDRVTGQVLWEGRASFTVRSTSPLADTGLAAPKMAEALFAGFPGKSGETIEVR